MKNDLMYAEPARSPLGWLKDAMRSMYGKEHLNWFKTLGQGLAKAGVFEKGHKHHIKDTTALAVAVIKTMRSLEKPKHINLALVSLMPSSWEVVTQRYKEKTNSDGADSWEKPVWADETWWQESPYYYTHFIHASEKIPGNVAFAENLGKAWADRYTTMKPGRYLTRFFGGENGVLSEKEIKEWADKQVAATAPREVEFVSVNESATVDEIRTAANGMIRVINLGPSDSCMSAGSHGCETWFKGHIHPAAIYATPDITIAYMENHEGEVTARAVCNKEKKRVARIYGDSRRLLPALEALGYVQEEGALIGCRIRKIENRRGDGYIMAYVDAGTGSGGGALGYTDCEVEKDKYWKLCRPGTGQGSTYEGYEHKGVTQSEEPMCRCEDCGDEMSEDESCYIESAEVTVCENCRDSNYTYAIGRRHEDWFVNEDVIECLTNNTYYFVGYANHHDVYMCEECGDWYKLDDLVSTSRGNVHHEIAVGLAEEDSEGNTFAVEQDTVETHDGRTIHKDTAKIVVINGEEFVCYENDDEDALRADHEANEEKEQA